MTRAVRLHVQEACHELWGMLLSRFTKMRLNMHAHARVRRYFEISRRMVDFRRAGFSCRSQVHDALLISVSSKT